MSRPPEREWRFYLNDMMDCAEKVLAYTEGLDQVDIIWDIIQNSIPELLTSLKQLLTEAFSQLR